MPSPVKIDPNDFTPDAGVAAIQPKSAPVAPMGLPPGITPFDLLAGPKGLAAAIARQRSEQAIDQRQANSEAAAERRLQQSEGAAEQRLLQSEQFQRGKQQFKLVPTRDAEGHPISVWYDPTSGQPVQGLPPIKGRLTTNELSGLEATKSLQLDVPKLQQAVQAIVHGSPAKLAMEYRKYAFPMFGMGGVTDPAYQEYFSQIGNVKSELARLQSSGSSRSFQLLKFIQDHIPKETDSPQAALHKLSTLERGRFDSLTKSILGDEGVAPTDSLPPAVDLPPSSMIPEGMIVPLNHKGKVHYYQKRNGQVSEVSSSNG